MTTSVFLSGGQYSVTRVEWPDGELTQEYPFDRESSEVYTLQPDGVTALWTGRIPRAPDPAELLVYQTAAKLWIDGWTEDWIINGPGFEYPGGSGHFYSLTLPAQSSWNGMANGLTFGILHPEITPIPFRTKDDSYVMALTTTVEAVTFFGYALEAVATNRIICQMAKTQIDLATTYAEVDALVMSFPFRPAAWVGPVLPS